MNDAVVLAINPRFAELIYSGRKTLEVRTCRIKAWGLPVLLYETAPVSRVTGVIRICGEPYSVLRGDIDSFCRACISGSDPYIRTVRQLIGYPIGGFLRFEDPVPLSDLGVCGTIRSFRYIEHLPESVRGIMEEEAWTARGSPCFF